MCAWANVRLAGTDYYVVAGRGLRPAGTAFMTWEDKSKRDFKRSALARNILDKLWVSSTLVVEEGFCSRHDQKSSTAIF